MPNCTLVIYVLVLVMDLVVGCSIIVWKCKFSESEEECELAAGGTVGSVIIWILIMLVCPCFATWIEICVTLDNFKKKCIKYMDKIRPKKSRDVVIQKEANNQTTTVLLDKGQAPSVNQRSNINICNETRGARDQSAIIHNTDRARNHIPPCHGPSNQTTVIKYLQQDVP
ncbi:uncharacterized protein LOC123561279 isoform X2 [Mercenaria mercenaria]|nr:uncharacterized protein LOC123561279 isoform X2 [Mercenaria mercenaria]XP_045209467.1 uncharacterized protein LOC123561279 isoform X2 [Mercenaria mercenaria]